MERLWYILLTFLDEQGTEAYFHDQIIYCDDTPDSKVQKNVWRRELGTLGMYESQQQVPPWVSTLDESELPSGFSVVRAGNIEDVATCRGATSPMKRASLTAWPWMALSCLTT